MKRMISGLAVLLCLLCVLGTAAADYTEGYFRYTVADGSVTITGYFGREAHVRVPAMIAGCPVNTIAAGAFVNTGVSSVTLPDTVTLVEVNAMGENITVYFDTGSSAPPAQTPPGDEGGPSGEGAAETTPTQAAGVETTETTPTQAAGAETTETTPTQAAGVETTETVPAQAADVGPVETVPVQAAEAETTPAQDPAGEVNEAAPAQTVSTAPAETVPAQTVSTAPTETTPAQAAGSASVGHEEIEGVLTEAEAAAAVSADTGHRFSPAAFLLGLLLAVYRQAFAF